VQVDPIKPTLKAPGIKRLTLKCDEQLSKIAFTFNLRRYSKGEERHIRGAANVLSSLTSNARSIFRLLAEHQLSNPEGMAFQTFYTQCREQFLATNEITLRSHLTEFVDHELTRTR